MDRHSMPPASQAFDLDRKIIEDFGASTDPDEFLRQLNAADAAREKAMNADDALARAAAHYGRLGIAIFPCEVRGKRPLARLAPNGVKNATCDADRIAAWWKAEPQANIGLATGLRYDVVDIDGPEGHRSIADKWAALMKIARAVVTTGNGMHVYVDATGNGNTARTMPGVDSRGRGGYVIAPPSRHANGDLYRWSTTGTVWV